jgi:DNA-binding MarR family transcriptional regulator
MPPMDGKLTKTQLEAWRLFIMAHSRIINIIDARLAAAEKIPLNWYDVLIELYEAPDRKLRMQEIAHRVVLSRSGLTRLVDRLEEAGLLTREDDPQDRRGSYAVITDAGIEAMRQAWPIYADVIAEYFAKDLDLAQLETLIWAFTKMLKHTEM